jgi:hypothetical protein
MKVKQQLLMVGEMDTNKMIMTLDLSASITTIMKTI